MNLVRAKGTEASTLIKDKYIYKQQKWLRKHQFFNATDQILEVWPLQTVQTSIFRDQIHEECK